MSKEEQDGLDKNPQNTQQLPEQRGSKQIADSELQGKIGSEPLSTSAGEPIPSGNLESVPNNPGDLEEFKGQLDSMIPETGETNTPPIEMTEEVKQEIVTKQSEDDAKREEIRSNTKEYGNSLNEWKLIQKTYNNQLDWEHTTTAMRIGTRGVIVHIKEAIGQKVNSTSVYIDNGQLIEKNGKWILK